MTQAEDDILKLALRFLWERWLEQLGIQADISIVKVNTVVSESDTEGGTRQRKAAN